MTRPRLARPRIAFFGTPEFAVSTLSELNASGKFEIALVVTETDKPAGRGHKLKAPPVKEFALSCGLPFVQPASVRKMVLETAGAGKALRSSSPETAAVVEQLNSAAPEAIVTVAYGKILPDALLNFPPRGVINVHASLLPRWRGAAPIHRALFAGDSETGICIMKTERALDTGPIYALCRTAIDPLDTFGTLHDRLAEQGAALIVATLPKILAAGLAPVPQAAEGATHAQKWLTADRDINWAEAAAVTLRRIRACAPSPGARTIFGEQSVKVLSAYQLADQNFPSAAPGEIVEVNRGELVVAAGNREFIAIAEMQFPGKARLPIKEVLTGREFERGDRFR